MPLLKKTNIDKDKISKSRNEINGSESIGKKTDLKLIISTIFAVLSTLLLLYVIYTISFKRESIFVEKFLFPQVNIKGEIESFGSKEIVAEGELEVLEDKLRKNKRLQELKLYGDIPVKVDKVGNENPFAPFGSVWGVPLPEKPTAPSADQGTASPVEKPLPVIN